MNPETRKRPIYLITMMYCLAIWMYSALVWKQSLSPPGQSCYFITWFGIPCPVCGGSHAIQSGLQGQWPEALQYNPLVFLVFLATVLISLTLVYDLILKKELWLKVWSGCIVLFRNKSFRYGLALLLIVHWGFNVLKYMKG